MVLKKGFRALVDEAAGEIDEIEAADASKLHGKDDVVFVDLRDQREREREGTIENSFSCPRGMLEFWIDPESPYAKPIFVEGKKYLFFCASGWRSALATKTAQDMGLAKVAHIKGGFTAWKDAGGPVAKIERR